MKNCKNCGHKIRRIKGIWMHRKEHSKYNGVGGSGGVTFRKLCLNILNIDDINKVKYCACNKPKN